MNILIGCEESQVLCGAFRRAGYQAYSCDTEPTRGNPDWHYKADIMDVIPLFYWDLIVLHPPCTAIALSGNAWYGRNMRDHAARVTAIAWTHKLWQHAIAHGARVALENPRSVIFKRLPVSKVVYIHPWQHGHGEIKPTGFALHNLPVLVPTRVVDGRSDRIHKMPPSDTRKRDRSVTYTGIASAIVDQWGALL